MGTRASFQNIILYSLDTRMYPFDSQNCSFVFPTWIHLGNVLQLLSYYDKMRFHDFEENGEWTIIASSSKSRYLHWDDYYIPRFHLGNISV